MDRNISIANVRARLHEIVDQVQHKGASYIINRNGKPVAAMVSMAIYENWKHQRKTFFDQVRTLQQNANLDSAESEKLAGIAVHAVRSKRKK